ncbi:hypothetical protein MmazTMA_21470 [Methanosarcina mazei]|nr:hypothetical protein MmazTMA_21470 [Methanosarcina mazei]
MNNGTAKCENTSIIKFTINNKFRFSICEFEEVWIAITASTANPLK